MTTSSYQCAKGCCFGLTHWYIAQTFFFKKMWLIIICVRLYNERLSSERGCIPYWCFPWSHITGFTFVLGFSSINYVIQGPIQYQLCFLEVFDGVCPFPLAEVDYDDVPFVTLMDVLTYSEVSYLFPIVFYFIFYASRCNI